MQLVFRIVKKIIEAGLITRVEITGNTSAGKRSNITVEKNMLLIPQSKRVNNIVVEIPVWFRSFPRCFSQVNDTKPLLFYPVKSCAFSTNKKISGSSFSHYIYDTNTGQIVKNKGSLYVLILQFVLVKLAG